MRIVTLGGGHGQAALLGALRGLSCELAAVVSVADDGGCSGKLRGELGIPPPGDVRRCLSTLARNRMAAELVERRYDQGRAAGRCIGNLALAELAISMGGLTKAAVRLGSLLGSTGRVLPVADAPGTLAVYDLEHGQVDGESRIEKMSGRAVVAAVHGPERATDAALEAIVDADLLLFGPGSFVGSTLAVLTTGDVGRAVAESSGRLVLVRNVARDEHTNVPGAVDFDDHERLFRDHLLIGTLGDRTSFDVLAHGDAPGSSIRPDGSVELVFPVAHDGARRHDQDRLAAALAHHFDLEPRSDPPPSIHLDSAVREIDELARLGLRRIGLG
jgi:uncharacterized cofD-like protein